MEYKVKTKLDQKIYNLEYNIMHQKAKALNRHDRRALACLNKIQRIEKSVKRNNFHFLMMKIMLIILRKWKKFIKIFAFYKVGGGIPKA
jgi:hypothetical protein